MNVIRILNCYLFYLFYMYAFKKGNPERIHTTPMLMNELAKVVGSRVISWKFKAFSRKNVNFYDEVDKLTGDYQERVKNLISLEYSELTGYFVAGAPIIFTTNISPLRGIANGSKGRQYSLNWLTQDLHDEAIEYLSNNQGNY